MIRPAVQEDFDEIRKIERASAQRFREFGLDQIADDEPESIEALARFVAAGHAWIATRGETLLGYVLVDEIDGFAHIEQVSVDPRYQGQGVGRALVEHVAHWALESDIPTLTLTTFSHIPWNKPLYEHLGFRVVSEEELTPGLAAIRDVEATMGLDPGLRVVMRLDVQHRRHQ